MKQTKRDKINLFFSSFLMIGYIICSYFFSTLAAQVSSVASTLINIAVYVLFGLLVFYATRVGEGVPIKRFSPIVLIVLDIPSLYIILATFITGLPFHEALVSQSVVAVFACIALGYGIPYTFLSGFEMSFDDETNDAVVAGGIQEELSESSDDSDSVTDNTDDADDTIDTADSADTEADYQ